MNMTTVPSDKLKAMQHQLAEKDVEIAALKEQITNAKYNYLGAMADCKQYEETIEQQVEAIRVKNVALRVAQLYLDGNCHSHKTVSSALAVQPSPEILQTRDEQVAEACAQYVYAMGGTKGSVLLAEMLLSGEWRKHL